MELKDYRPRIIDKTVDLYLSTFGALCIEGPKWCGKTWTSLVHSRSQIFLGDPAGNFQNRELARMDTNLVLDGQAPRLIDEWQEVPSIWDAVRFKVDQMPAKGNFILTGSATPKHKGILHSGTGRIATLRMCPMSLYESGDSSGVVSLKNLFSGKLKPLLVNPASLQDLIALIIRGGWPGSVGMDLKKAALVLRSYLKSVLDEDVYQLDGVKRDADKMRLLLRSLARNEATTVSNNTLKNDIKNKDDETVDLNTIVTYLNIFDRLFLTDNQEPFSTNIRSSVRVKQAFKRHFTDPSLACAALGVTASQLLHDLRTLSFLFEALCERDLKIYAAAANGKLYHYQDYKGREIDAVVELEDGRWGAFEIKLGANQIDAAAANLLHLAEEIGQEHPEKAPSLLCVVCGLSNAAYLRPDGVAVVPITALKD